MVDPTPVRVGTRSVLFAVFAVTGFSALTLQIVWQRIIALHSGVDLVSITTVVAAFLAGLGLGNLLGGWLADRLGPTRSVMLFGCSEIAVGLFAWASIFLFYDLYQAQAENLTTVGAKFAFNATLVLLPATLMGLSLPLVARSLVSRVRDAGPIIGRLYAVNTIGAATGAALSGWVLLGTFGFVTVTRLAGLANVVAGLLVLAVIVPAARAVAASEVRVVAVDPVAPPRAGAAPETGDSGRARVWPWFAVYGITGAVALGFEVLFFRVIDSVMRSNAYSFPHMLASYLVFFGVGSAIGSIVVRRTSRPDRWFLALQFLVGLSALGGLIFLTRVLPNTPFADAVATYLGGNGFATGLRNPDGGYNEAFLPVFFGVPLIVMAAPVLFMGASFPCAQALVNDRLDTLGRRTGQLVAVNILGNVAGTLLVGFVLIDLLGTAGTYRLLAALLVIPGLAAVWLSEPSRRAVYGALTVGALVVVLLASPSQIRFWSYLHSSPKDRLALAEDRSCATALKQVNGSYVMTVNGASQNNFPFDDFHVLIGMVPIVVHPDPGNAMALGLGIGGTAYGLASDPRTERIDTVEICGGQVDLLQGLAAGGAFELQRFFEDPRQHVTIGDGRDHLLRTDRTYDVVVVDTLRPQAAFSSNLYSKEFYELVQSRLAPGGLMAQWTPSPRVVNTITEVFPHVIGFRVPQYYDSPFVVASKEPIDFDREAALEHLADASHKFSEEQYLSLRTWLETTEAVCIRDGSPAPPVEEEGLIRDLEPRDEFFLNNPTVVVERPTACAA